MRKINEIIIHCTGNSAYSKINVKGIDRYHREERKFSCIGYHFVITTDGEVYAGRALDKEGAHCLGHNENSIGIAYVGGLGENDKPANTLNIHQRSSLHRLCRLLCELFPITKISGHNQYANKACPCFDVQDVVPLENVMPSFRVHYELKCSMKSK